MSTRLLVTLTTAALGLAAVGCGGYGDEVEGDTDTTPALEQMVWVNDWLTRYQEAHGAVPPTYEALTNLYEQDTGTTWPPFPSGGSWGYLPHRARVIEVREEWVRGWLRQLNRKAEEAEYQMYGVERVAMYFREEEGIEIQPPGYEITMTHGGTQHRLSLKYTADGAHAVRGHHTASEAWDITNQGEIVAVPGGARQARPRR